MDSFIHSPTEHQLKTMHLLPLRHEAGRKCSNWWGSARWLPPFFSKYYSSDPTTTDLFFCFCLEILADHLYSMLQQKEVKHNVGFLCHPSTIPVHAISHQDSCPVSPFSPQWKLLCTFQNCGKCHLTINEQNVEKEDSQVYILWAFQHLER